MVLRIRSGVPLVWRTTEALQIGVARHPVVLDGVTREEELLVAALHRGITRAGLDAIARERRIPHALVESVLARLEPLLERDARREYAGALVLGEGPLAAGLAALTRAAGNAPDAGRLALAVLVVPWLVVPAESGRWLRRDVPHLPVVVADGVVTVGPFVRPGEGPCLHCVDRHRIDADPTWPAVAAQLLDRPAPVLSSVDSASATGLAARTIVQALDGRLAPGVERRLDLEDGTISERTWTAHPECGCAAPPGIDSASAAAPIRPALRLVETR